MVGIDASTGLTAAEATLRLTEFGENRLPSAPPRPLWRRVWAQVRDPMILLLLAAGALTSVLGDVPDTVIIVVVVVLNTLIGVVQEVRAEKAIAALHALTAPLASVVRDGEVVQIPAHEVVPGDVLRLAAGDLVSADAVVLSAHRLQLDRSAMTGESVPVDIVDRDEVTAGTLVTRGRGVAAVSRTGAESGLGRLALLIAEAPERPTPLELRLRRLSRLLVGIVGILTGLVVVLGLLQHRSLTEMAIVGVSLAVAAVPESLPAVVAVALAMGAHRMALRQAVVRKLPAVETLGSVSVIATDKTGTLTEGRMVAERLWTPAAAYDVTGRGYAPEGGIEPTGERADTAAPDLTRLLRDVALCNDSRLVRDGEEWTAEGDPMEAALLVVTAKGGLSVEEVSAAWPRDAEEPFDHATLHMRTWHTGADGARLVVCKGAPEAVLPLVGPGGAVSEARAVAESLAAQGYRVIAVADHTVHSVAGPSSARPLTRGDEPLELVGLVAIDDPPRALAGEVVGQCQRAGIRLILVTGDHPGTAEAIARRTGILTAGQPPGAAVHARVQPEDKVAIVRSLQDGGEVVAMLGDGVNDAPALRTADIGVAAGLGGTEVARQAADLVLMDDNLATVVHAVEEGRRIFANIRSFLVYAVSGGLSEVGVMILGPFLGMASPLLPAQILWINLLTHGLTGVAFGAEPADPAEMARPPRPPAEGVFTRGLARRLALAATCLVLVSLASAVLVTGSDRQRTALFLTLGLGQLGVALALRARGRGGLRGLDVAVAVAALLQVTAALTPLLRGLLRTVPLNLHEVLVAVALAAIPGLVVGVSVRLERRRTLRAAERPQPESTQSA